MHVLPNNARVREKLPVSSGLKSTALPLLILPYSVEIFIRVNGCENTNNTKPKTDLSDRMPALVDNRILRGCKTNFNF
jgi:hypothetical protein